MNEQEKKEKKPRNRMNGEKKFYLFTAIGCAAVLVAIIIVAVVVTNTGSVQDPTGMRDSSSISTPIDSSNGGNTSTDKPDPNEPTVGVPETMSLPMDAVTVSNDFGFYHNVTLNNYYEHKGIDFVAPVGTEVKAVKSGTIESIYKADILLGTEIVVNHGDGLKTVYRFVTEKEGLKVGDTIEKGEVIATVAEASGNEYKEGAHLHFEILENGKQVDPTLHLTLEDK